MTHTLHRTGDLQSLGEDFPMLTHVARGFNDQGASPRLKRIAETMVKYSNLHFGDCKVGNRYMMDPAEIMDKLTVGCQTVFKDKESLIACMKELKQIDQGISIVVSGLFDEVLGCCKEAGHRAPLNRVCARSPWEHSKALAPRNPGFRDHVRARAGLRPVGKENGGGYQKK